MSERTELDSARLRVLLRLLKSTEAELGVGTTIRQLATLCHIALANNADERIGVRDIDRLLGDLPNGTASKMLRPMMHEESQRKPGLAETVRAVRNASDLRSWDLELTAKSKLALRKILEELELL